ncbi:MAG TPA: hypothetical protein ENK55_07305 [Actinobacteria bacterium]|nr:hypothetical protein [Actinomycetota bacterium]
MTERGSMLPLVGALILTALVVVAFAGDVALLAAGYREAAFAADAGAEAGAAVVVPTDAYGGAVVVDVLAAPEVAREAATAARPRPGRTVEVHAEPERVCVVVRQPAVARFFPDQVVVATACAEPRRG